MKEKSVNCVEGRKGYASCVGRRKNERKKLMSECKYVTKQSREKRNEYVDVSTYEGRKEGQSDVSVTNNNKVWSGRGKYSCNNKEGRRSKHTSNNMNTVLFYSTMDFNLRCHIQFNGKKKSKQYDFYTQFIYLSNCYSERWRSKQEKVLRLYHKMIPNLFSLFLVESLGFLKEAWLSTCSDTDPKMQIHREIKHKVRQLL